MQTKRKALYIYVFEWGLVSQPAMETKQHGTAANQIYTWKMLSSTMSTSSHFAMDSCVDEKNRIP